jgi:hypothetical protein
MQAATPLSALRRRLVRHFHSKGIAECTARLWCGLAGANEERLQSDSRDWWQPVQPGGYGCAARCADVCAPTPMVCRFWPASAARLAVNFETSALFMDHAEHPLWTAATAINSGLSAAQ